MEPALTLEDYWVSRVTGFNTCASLAVLIWDWLVNIDEEVVLVWSVPNTAPIKWVYFFLRYGGIVLQIANIRFVARMETYVPIPSKYCRLWIAYQAITAQVMMMLVEGLFMLRAYAMWKRSRKVAVMLFLLAVLEDIFNDLCLFIKPPLGAVIFSIAALLAQIVTMLLTLIRYNTARLSGWARSPLVTLVVREGGISFLTISALLMVGVIYTFIDSKYGDIMFYWVLSLLSASGCRSIVNMRRLSATRGQSAEDSHLTTEIWIEADYTT
ncbi:hypothetical protein BV22DRAFT_566366 [Leucogyrophana mollusca]|uniref:Uncharacterized protein n=1 Tax=Leucogyrophana mollusca TaxID=85980 RepID=A0ACB8BEJ6_9AGAM|nr:hypothetical protein BV22DRAFT_566366 [Leucogyrophana mollusca]